MKSTHDHTTPVRFPILQGVLPITAARIPAEILAGVTLASIAIPEVMGYTKISGVRSGMPGEPEGIPAGPGRGE